MIHFRTGCFNSNQNSFLFPFSHFPTGRFCNSVRKQFKVFTRLLKPLGAESLKKVLLQLKENEQYRGEKRERKKIF